MLSHYPQIRKQIIETAEERQRLVRERAEAAAKKKEEERKKQEELERQKTIKELESADRESTKQEGTFPDSENKNESVSSNQEVSKGSFLKELIFASWETRTVYHDSCSSSTPVGKTFKVNNKDPKASLSGTSCSK